jgi:hypothetical protein
VATQIPEVALTLCTIVSRRALLLLLRFRFDFINFESSEFSKSAVWILGEIGVKRLGELR